MNTFKLGKKWMAVMGGGLAALALTMGFAFGPAASAFADDGTPPAPVSLGANVDARLAEAYQREQEWLARQTENLSRATEGVSRAESLIARIKSRGEDTSALETALAALKSDLAKAQAAHDTAAGILSAHAGFDAQGQVTDRAQARETLQSARAALQAGRAALLEGVHTAREAVRAWREAHPRPTSPGDTATSDKGL